MSPVAPGTPSEEGLVEGGGDPPPLCAGLCVRVRPPPPSLGLLGGRVLGAELRHCLTPGGF